MSFRLASKIVFETEYGKMLLADEEENTLELATLENRIFLYSRLSPILANLRRSLPGAGHFRPRRKPAPVRRVAVQHAPRKQDRHQENQRDPPS